MVLSQRKLICATPLSERCTDALSLLGSGHIYHDIHACNRAYSLNYDLTCPAMLVKNGFVYLVYECFFIFFILDNRIVPISLPAQSV